MLRLPGTVGMQPRLSNRRLGLRHANGVDVVKPRLRCRGVPRPEGRLVSPIDPWLLVGGDREPIVVQLKVLG